MTTLVDELNWRGLLYDATPTLETRLARGSIAGYVGFDPTAPSLQIGNLVPVMLLAHLQRHGGTPIILVGGGTGLIGDPSGKSAERPLLTADDVDAHAEQQRVQLERFLDFSGSNAARTLNNADWLRGLTLVDFLRDIGKHFTLSHMLQKESVKSRMETGISFTEFSYMLLQAFDFLHLYRHHGCELQMGGSDQWGNITAGAELIRRADGGEAHGLSAPLLTTASGTKFGKSEEGAVWLDPAMTSPYRFLQFWINQDDRDVERLLKIFTFRSAEEIGGLMEDHLTNPSARTAQRALADELTTRVHGEDAKTRAEEASAVMFGQVPVREAGEGALQLLERELPGWSVGADEFPMPLPDLLARSGFTKSKGEARRQLQQGGVYVNGERASVDFEVTADQLLAGRYLWVRRGKKTDLLVRVGTGA